MVLSSVSARTGACDIFTKPSPFSTSRSAAFELATSTRGLVAEHGAQLVEQGSKLGGLCLCLGA